MGFTSPKGMGQFWRLPGPLKCIVSPFVLLGRSVCYGGSAFAVANELGDCARAMSSADVQESAADVGGSGIQAHSRSSDAETPLTQKSAEGRLLCHGNLLTRSGAILLDLRVGTFLE